jgi:polyisoprenoid-binding protein YceI
MCKQLFTRAQGGRFVMSTTATQSRTEITGTWNLDKTHSSVGFSVLYMGVAPFEGAFRKVDATLDAAGLRGTAVAASVDVDDENLAGHLASPEFFDVADHPTITFESGPIAPAGNEVAIEGTLEIKGHRVPVVLTGDVTGPVADPWGNRKLALTLATTVDRTRFELNWNAPLPEGGEILGRDVELTATLVFVAAQES